MGFLERLLSKFGYIKITNKISNTTEITNAEYIIKFRDKTDAIHAIYASNMYSVLWEMRMNTRRRIKWFVSDNPQIDNNELIEEIFNIFNRELETNGLTSLIET